MSPYTIFMCTLFTFLLSFHGIDANAVKYNIYHIAEKHPVGIKFTNIIGMKYTKDIMAKINNYLWSTIFQQNTDADRKIVDSVDLYLKDFKGAEGITWWSSRINVSVVYLDGYQGNFTWEFTSLMYHEMTHVFQWNGEGKAPVGLTEGIADYTILKANYFPSAFAKPGSGDKWDQGYDFTARFLEYCDSLVPNFVAKLNKRMRKTFDVSFFKELTGKPVEQLWKDYKAKYAGKN
ncbi:hypothetical protein Tco_0485437 [Tanacetum coccineum]